LGAGQLRGSEQLPTLKRGRNVPPAQGPWSGWFSPLQSFTDRGRSAMPFPAIDRDLRRPRTDDPNQSLAEKNAPSRTKRSCLLSAPGSVISSVSAGLIRRHGEYYTILLQGVWRQPKRCPRSQSNWKVPIRNAPGGFADSDRPGRRKALARSRPHYASSDAALKDAAMRAASITFKH